MDGFWVGLHAQSAIDQVCLAQTRGGFGLAMTHCRACGARVDGDRPHEEGCTYVDHVGRWRAGMARLLAVEAAAREVVLAYEAGAVLDVGPLRAAVRG